MIIIKKQDSGHVSRVLFPMPKKAKVLCHLSNLQVTLQLKRSTLHRNSQRNIGREPSDDGIHELAASSRHSPNGHPMAGGLLHHLLTLTFAGGCFLLPEPTVTNSFYFRKWSPYAARTFLSYLNDTSDKACPLSYITDAKLVKKRGKKNY